MMNGILQQAGRATAVALSNFAKGNSFWSDFKLAFGEDFDRTQAQAIRQALIDQSFARPVSVLADQSMGVATGAYAAATDTIYLRESFVAAGDIAAISAVMVEELGHAIDSRINKVETPGDEGAIFSMLVHGIKIAQHVLAQLQTENDWGTILVNNQQLVVEMAVINGTNDTDYLLGTVENDQINGLGGNDFLFTQGVGIDTLDGGDGIDYAELEYRSATTGMTVTLNADGNGSVSDGSVLKSIEKLSFFGSRNNDFVDAAGTSDSNVFNSNGGQDNFIGGSGSDSFYISNGSKVDGGNGQDEVVFTVDGATYTGISLTFDINGNAIGDDGTSIKNIENFSFYGSLYNDYVNASTTVGNNFFASGGGSNTFIGGIGQDTYSIYSFYSNENDFTVIDDKGGNNDFLELVEVSTRNVFNKSGTSLGINFNDDQQDDLLILNFFNANGGAGTGAIEDVNGRSLASILKEFTPVKTDIGGDRLSDIIWRQGDGSVRLWQMEGINIAANSLLAEPIDTSWQIVDTGDLNGDSKADIIWSNTDGRISLWQMDGSTILATDVLSPETGWKVAGAGNFGLNDSKTDILWRKNNGDVAIWQMDGANVLSSKVLGNVDNSWQVAETGDFNGDQNSDVLWRKDNGDVAIWLMNGDAVASAVVRGNVSADWKIAGVNDFNDDGNADVAWQNADGRIAIWRMNGSEVVFANVIGNAAGFTVVGTGDYDGDRVGDLLLRNAQGDNAIWSTDGRNIFAQSAIASTDPSWKAMPAGLDVSAPPVLLT